jgi:hypothetical protein
MTMEWIENEFRDLVGCMAAFNGRVEAAKRCKPDAEIPISQSAIDLFARELGRLPVSCPVQPSKEHEELIAACQAWRDGCFGTAVTMPAERRILRALDKVSDALG